MQRRFAGALLSVIVAAVIAVTAALAQDGARKPWLETFIEAIASTPDRQVSLSGLEGAFSAHPTVETITVSDSEGPWLELEGVEIAWNRAALLDRMLAIDSLRVRRVDLLRKPVPGAETEESSGGGRMPIAVTVDSISLPLVVIAAPVAGAEAELAAAGSAQLTQEAIAAQLSAYRQDRAGTFTVELRLEPDANLLTADLALNEPEGGLVADLLDLPNRPAIAAKLSGSGSLDDWKATLTLAANGDTVLSGDMAIARADAAYRIVADMAASLETLAPADYAPLVAGESRLALHVSRGDDGAITIDEATLRSAGMDLSASGALTPDRVPEHAVVSLRLGQAGRTALPFAPGEASVESLQVNAELERGATAPWRVGVAAVGLESEYGRFSRLTLNANGEASNLAEPSTRGTTFRANATVDGLVPSDPGLRAALGQEVQVASAGQWSAGGPATIDNLQLVLDHAAMSFAGTASGEALDGSFGATASDLSRFATLAGRSLAGSTQINADGSVGTDGSADLQLDGETTDLKLGIAPLDALLAGVTNVSGGIARTDEGLSFDDLALANDRVTASVNGSFADPELDLTVEASVADLSLATERATGAAQISATLSGTSSAPRVEAEATGDEIVLMGRPLSNASARFSGVVAGPDTAGDAEIGGTFGDASVSGTARLAAGEGGARRIEGLDFAVGESSVSGDLIIRSDGLFSGDLRVDSPDLTKVAPLFLVDASGMVRADVTLSAADGVQSAVVSGTATDIVYENVTLESAKIDGRGQDLFGAPRLDGDFVLRNLNAGGLTIVSATGAAERQGEGTTIAAEAQLADGEATLRADLVPQDGGLAIGLQRFSFARNGLDLALASPTTINVADGGAAFDNATLTASGGSATITGRAGQALDLDIALASVPAGLANTFSPGLGAEGTISGNVAVSGTASDPVATFDIDMANASVAAARNAGLRPLSVAAQGNFADGSMRLTSRISGADGMAVNVNGTVGTANGTPLDLAINGAVPLSLGNRQLASRGAAFSGALNVDIKVTGTAASPQFAGRVTSEGGGFVDPESGIVLSNLSLAASVSNNRLVIERLNAASGEGTVSAEGSLGLDPNQGLPVDMRITIRKARYVDGTLIAATFDADLTLSGKLSESPELAGRVTLDRTEITVPEQLPGDSVAVAVEHVDPPQPVEQTLEVVRERQRRQQADGGGPSGIRLDISVGARQRIFVRGRGLDAELGGRIRLFGSTSSILASGRFELVRGRLDILTKRITLSRGIITFAGDLDPILDFVGTTTSGDVTITIAIAGRASDPQVTFTSVPELPQDEILAQLIFQKGIGELSPLQVARLASAASALAGGGGGLLGQIRASTGLDDLDIVVDEEGQAAVAAGRYVSEDVYIGVQQGATAESSRVTIDLDITKRLKARAGYSAEGESSLGIFFEKEY